MYEIEFFIIFKYLLRCIILLFNIQILVIPKMARGQQKIQSQAKAAEKSAKMKKQQGHSANEQKKAAQKALVHVCSVCKVSIEFI